MQDWKSQLEKLYLEKEQRLEQQNSAVKKLKPSIKDVVDRKAEEKRMSIAQASDMVNTTRNTMPSGGGLSLDTSASKVPSAEAPASTTSKTGSKNVRDFYSGLLNKNVKKKAAEKKKEEQSNAD